MNKHFLYLLLIGLPLTTTVTARGGIHMPDSFKIEATLHCPRISIDGRKQTITVDKETITLKELCSLLKLNKKSRLENFIKECTLYNMLYTSTKVTAYFTAFCFMQALLYGITGGEVHKRADRYFVKPIQRGAGVLENYFLNKKTITRLNTEINALESRQTEISINGIEITKTSYKKKINILLLDKQTNASLNFTAIIFHVTRVTSGGREVKGRVSLFV